jgi:hypothetical protein
LETSHSDKPSTTQVIGTTSLYENGQIRLIPVSRRKSLHAVEITSSLEMLIQSRHRVRIQGVSINFLKRSAQDDDGSHKVDPLNLPQWRKWTAIGCLCFCKSSYMIPSPPPATFSTTQHLTDLST